ncbi:MAG: hypothetical protein J7483_07285 [Novosphingobium sp.]|nr:hypothetical protein [Novosphingobium sp.]
MRTIILALGLIAAFPAAAFAQTAATAAASHYSVDQTPVGTLIDDPAAKAVLDKLLPGFTSDSRIDMARGMTLKALQPYSGGTFTDAVLARVDAELAKLPAKK